MADQQSLLEKYLKQYWEHLKNRPGICITSRESVKNSIIYYDVKREQDYRGDAWQRMCEYKLAKDNFDCDVSYLVMLQCAITFPHVLLEGREIQPQYRKRARYELTSPKNSALFCYRGDTMNSYAKTVHEYLNISAANSQINWETCMLEPYQCLDAIISEEARCFIQLNHTIGNFIPVPFEEAYKKKDGEKVKTKHFNSPRGLGPTKDYWDLALLAIYEWYTQQNDEALKEMLQEKGKNTENAENTNLCKKWLECFQTWPRFVRANYMEPFVHDNYGEPKELWKGHFTYYKRLKKQALPETAEQFSEFFHNASMWILARGELIAEAIIKELEKTPKCRPWKEDN